MTTATKARPYDPTEYLPEEFVKQIADHRMTVLRDDGLYRHLKFARPGTSNMHFYLTTWPGTLAFTGDMGTFVFKRLEDMFTFFRCPDDWPLYSISCGYWAEKCVAADRDGGYKEYSEDACRDSLAELIGEYVEDMEPDEAEALRDRFDREVLSCLCDGGIEHAYGLALEFEHRGRPVFELSDGLSCHTYTHHFVWCCLALRWAIAQYDAHPRKETPCPTTP